MSLAEDIPDPLVPPDARIDPTSLPEEDFPLYCARCGYALKSLPGLSCPECGLTFDPGRRLVEQYYFGIVAKGGKGYRLRRWEAMAMRAIYWVAALAAFAFVGLIAYGRWLHYRGPVTSELFSDDVFVGVVMSAFLGSGFFGSIVCLLLTTRFFVGRRKRAQVYEIWRSQQAASQMPVAVDNERAQL